MRKVGTSKDVEDRRKKNMIYISSFILLVLIIGTIGYGFLSKPDFENAENTNKNEEGKVIEENGIWKANIDGQIFVFSNSPESTKNISVDISSSINDLTGAKLYIDANKSAILNEIAINLQNIAGKISEGCYGPCAKDLPEKNCSDNIIIWQDKPKNKVYQEENCIFIEGDLKAVDAFLFKILNLN